MIIIKYYAQTNQSRFVIYPVQISQNGHWREGLKSLRRFYEWNKEFNFTKAFVK